MELNASDIVELLESSSYFRDLAADALREPVRPAIDHTAENKKLLKAAVECFDPKREHKYQMVLLMRKVGRNPDGGRMGKPQSTAFVENNEPQYHPLYRKEKVGRGNNGNKVVLSH
jgi:hypothetical protein